MAETINKKRRYVRELERELQRLANRISHRSVPRPSTHRSDTQRWEIYSAGYLAPKSVKLDKARAGDLTVDALAFDC